MSIDGLAGAVESIDWDRPWLKLVKAQGQAVRASIAAGTGASAALNAAGSARSGIQFVPACQRPADLPYETYVHRAGCVPTRDDLHDLFNGLIWLAFPRTKHLLNRWQATEITRVGGTSGRQRGALRDALTVLDENGAFLQAPDLLWQALAARAWERLFIELRPLWHKAQLVLFGHALLEKLVQPRKAITAHVLRLPSVTPATDTLDAAMTSSLSPQRLMCRPAFVPLPVLGVPGWWPDNEAASFYADAKVFRLPKQCPST